MFLYITALCWLCILSGCPQVHSVASDATTTGVATVEQPAGEDVLLPCMPSSYTPLYEWYVIRPNRTVGAENAVVRAYSENRLFVIRDKFLIIRNAIVSDSGVYRCSSISTNGRYQTRTYTLTIRPANVTDQGGVNNEDAEFNCGRKRDRSRIVNGREVDRPGVFPWMALLWHKTYNKPFCGGALISNRWVVTAAHCFRQLGYRDDEVEVRLGEYNISSTEDYERTYDVALSIAHDNYDARTYDSDIMLLQLSQSVVYSGYIVPVCLPSVLKGERLGTAGNSGTVAGWGMTSETSLDEHTEVLRRARIQIRDQATCGAQHRNNIITNNMFCALGTGSGGTRDACKGDSGGPFVVREASSDRSYLVGVVSWGVGCGRSEFPGVYTRVTRFRQWILDNINADQTCRESQFQADEDMGQEQSRIESLQEQVSDLERQLQEKQDAAICNAPAPTTTTVAPTTTPPYVDEPIPCRRGSCWHTGGYRVWATCANGNCQCTSPYYNPVTCLPRGGSCNIRKNDPNNHAIAFTSRTDDPVMYSCKGGPGSALGDVHVLAVYEGSVHTRPPSAGDMTVTVMTDTISSSRPVILVLTNYEPVNWILQLPAHLNVTKVILVSYYSQQSTAVVNGGLAANVPVQKKSRSWPRGYGSDNGGGNTAGLLLRLSQELGNVTSFAGTYRADSWSWSLPTPTLPQRQETQAPSTGGGTQTGVGNPVVTTDQWTQHNFRYDRSWTSCSGEKYVRMRDDTDVSGSGRYVGAVLCDGHDNGRYKLFMSDELSETFKNIADSSGHGSDHCQFAMAASDDDFQSDSNYWHAPAAEGYYRSGWNEPMSLGSIGGGLGTSWTGRYYPKWYECGVTIP